MVSSSSSTTVECCGPTSAAPPPGVITPAPKKDIVNQSEKATGCASLSRPPSRSYTHRVSCHVSCVVCVVSCEAQYGQAVASDDQGDGNHAGGTGPRPRQTREGALSRPFRYGIVVCAVCAALCRVVCVTGAS
jgi:hypothetical protein